MFYNCCSGSRLQRDNYCSPQPLVIHCPVLVLRKPEGGGHLYWYIAICISNIIFISIANSIIIFIFTRQPELDQQPKNWNLSTLILHRLREALRINKLYKVEGTLVDQKLMILIFHPSNPNGASCCWLSLLGRGLLLPRVWNWETDLGSRDAGTSRYLLLF